MLVAAVLFKIEIDYMIHKKYFEKDIIHCILPIKEIGMGEVDCNIFENVVYIPPTSKISQPL